MDLNNRFTHKVDFWMLEMNQRFKEENKELTTKFANNLRKYRLSKKLSQNSMSKQLGLKRCTYAAYEETRGKPNFAVLLKISALLGVSIEAMISENLF